MNQRVIIMAVVLFVLIIVGMFTFAKNKQTARVASEFYINAINVMRGAESISEYIALSRQEAFERERQIKGWSRAKKLALIEQNWGRLQELSRSGDGSTSSP